MNEATFEGKLGEEIKRLFPMLNEADINYQLQFQLTLGHNTYLFDGTKKNKAIARSDVLIKYKEINLAMLELKAPGIALANADVIQGTSYARLLDPMPPITIVSNGEDTLFFNTYDRKPWSADGINEHLVQSLFKSGMKCASADRDEAIKILLGRDDDMWREMLLRYTKKALQEIEGDIGDFSYQVARDFQLERIVVNQLIEAVQDSPLINFVGSLLAGKTNAIYQLCKKCPNNLIPIYIDANLTYDPFEKLANWFCREIFRSFMPNEIKNWLINGFRNEAQQQNRIVFIFDNIHSVDDKLFWREIYQLCDINQDNTYTILLVMNEYIYESIGHISSGPAKNAIGKAPVISISALSDDEFYSAMSYFMEKYNAAFYQGAQCNVQYRNPRVLRILASQLPALSHDEDETTCGANRALFFPSYANYSVLESIWKKIVVMSEVRSDYRSFAEAMFDDMKRRMVDTRLAILSATRGVISLKTAEQTLGIDRINRMKKTGHIQLLSFGDGKTYLYPRFPEAVAIAAAYVLSDKMIEIIEERNTKEAYDFMMHNIDCIPYSDLAATRVIINVCREKNILWELICLLINDLPLVKPNNDCGTFGLYFSDIGHIKLSGELGGMLISNYNPWLLLSNLTTLPIGDESGARDIQVNILKVIGSFNDILIKPEDRPFRNMAGFHTHEFKGGQCICGKTGIIEPITYAMQCSFANMPEEMLQLSKEAIASDEFFLVMRLSVAAQSMCTLIDPLASESAKEAYELLNQYISDHIKRDAGCEF
jgi:hypothetical protein